MNHSIPSISSVTHRSWRTRIVALVFLLLLTLSQAWQPGADWRLAQLDSLNLSSQSLENQPSLAVNWSCRSECLRQYTPGKNNQS